MFINGDLPKDDKYPLSCVYWIHTLEMTNPKTQGYVGVSSRGYKRRFDEHKQAAVQGGTLPIHKAIRKYKESILIDELIVASPEFCLLVEAALRPTAQMGGMIWNVGSGGEATQIGFKHSDETRKKISDANQGKVLSSETKEKMSKSRLGWKASDKTKMRMIEVRTGKKASDETKQKMSKAQIGNTRALGYKHSQEAKDKISATASITTSKWLNPRASSVWSICLQLYDKFKQNSRNCDVAREFKVPESNVRNMYKRFRNGWNPNEDQEYLSWLEEKKGKQCHMN